MAKFIEYLKKSRFNKMIIRCYKSGIDRIFIYFISLFTRNKPLLDVIIFESYNDFDCNGGAFYNYLIKEEYNKKYKIIWLLKNKKPSNLPVNVKGYLMNRPNIYKDYYRCRAKHFICDLNILKKVREDQISVYCTHGGVSIKNTKGVLNVHDSVDYILSPSINFDKILCDKYSMPYPDHRILHIGYPFNDVYFNSRGNEIIKIYEGKYKKLFLWMPTFRKSKTRNDSISDLPLGIPLLPKEEDLIHLDNHLRCLQSILVVKIHPAQDLNTICRLIEAQSRCTNIYILDKNSTKEKGIDTYGLVSQSDALVSDYSAIAYSYLLLNRPLGFVLADLKDYKRGLIVDNPDYYMPGKKIFNLNDLLSFIKDTVDDRDPFLEERISLRDYLYEYKDGNSSKRLAQALGL